MSTFTREPQRPSAAPTPALRERLKPVWLLIVELRYVLAVVAVTLLAAFLRLYQLSDLPFGLRGDEAIVGVESRIILAHGWIGPYTPIYAGFPIGPLYFFAPLIGIFGDTVFAVRLGPAVLGIATIPVLYIAYRQAVSRRIALASVFVLAVSEWHIALSREAFPVAAWPFTEAISVAFLLAGIRTRRWYYYAAAGVAATFCWYAYEAAVLLPAGMGAFLALRFLITGGISRRREAALIVVFALGAIIAALPMLDYARRPENKFFEHRDNVSVTRTLRYKQADSLLEKARFFADKEGSYYKAIAFEAKPDIVDGIGIEPPIDALTAVLALAGVAIAAWWWRRPIYLLSLLMLPVMSLGAVMTFDGTYRRTFGIVPFVMLLAGTTLGLLWERTDALRPLRRAAALAALAALAAVIAFSNIHLYFNTFADSQLHRANFFPELTTVSEKIDSLPDGTWVYFYSGRAPRGHEIFRYIVGEDLSQGIDQSREFGTYSLVAPHKQGPLVFAFLDGYLADFPRVMARYPGGQVTERSDSYGLLYITYYFPPGSTLEGDGTTIAPTSELQPLPDSPTLPEGGPVPVAPSCVAVAQRPAKYTYYRYGSSAATYAVLREAQPPAAAGVTVIWESTTTGLREVSCHPTGAWAIPARAAEMSEVGLIADAGATYYIGVAGDPAPEGQTPPLALWQHTRP